MLLEFEGMSHHSYIRKPTKCHCLLGGITERDEQSSVKTDGSWSTDEGGKE